MREELNAQKEWGSEDIRHNVICFKRDELPEDCKAWLNDVYDKNKDEGIDTPTLIERARRLGGNHRFFERIFKTVVQPQVIAYNNHEKLDGRLNLGSSIPFIYPQPGNEKMKDTLWHNDEANHCPFISKEAIETYITKLGKEQNLLLEALDKPCPECQGKKVFEGVEGGPDDQACETCEHVTKARASRMSELLGEDQRVREYVPKNSDSWAMLIKAKHPPTDCRFRIKRALDENNDLVNINVGQRLPTDIDMDKGKGYGFWNEPMDDEVVIYVMRVENSHCRSMHISRKDKITELAKKEKEQALDSAQELQILKYRLESAQEDAQDEHDPLREKKIRKAARRLKKTIIKHTDIMVKQRGKLTTEIVRLTTHKGPEELVSFSVVGLTYYINRKFEDDIEASSR